jgi:hypothetical protein
LVASLLPSDGFASDSKWALDFLTGTVSAIRFSWAKRFGAYVKLTIAPIDGVPS